MAKRRDRPVENPIRQDLIKEIGRPVATREPDPVSTVVAEAPLEKLGDAETKRPKRRASKKKRSTRSKNQESRWSEPNSVQVKARFVHEDAAQIEEVRRRLSKLTSCNISTSHMTRALWSLMLHAGDGLDDIADKAPQLKRPPHGDHVRAAEYEDQIAAFLLRALKRVKREEM